MTQVKRLVLDVLKPHNPNIVELSKQLAEIDGINAVNINTYEIDKDVENVKVTLEGDNVDIEEVEKILKSTGGAVHSIDEAVAGNQLIESKKTLQD